MNKQVKGWIVCLAAACFFSYELVQLHMLNAICIPVMQSLGLSATEFSLLASGYLLADVLFLIPAGMILDRFSVRKVILTALGLCIAGTFGFGFSTNVWQAGFFHFVSGIGNAFCFLSCMMLASDWFGKRSSFVMSIVITIGLFGGVVAQVPFTKMVEIYDWQGTLFLDGLAGCVIWVVNYVFIRENSEKVAARKSLGRQPSPSLGLQEALRNGRVWLCGCYTGFLNLPLMIISAMIGSLYLTESLGFSPLDAAFVTGMISVGTIVGSPCYGYLADRFRKKRIWMIAGAVLSLLTFFFITGSKTPDLFRMSASFFLLGFFSASQVLGYPMIADSAPDRLKGTSMGVAAVIIMGLAFVAQPLTGLLIDLGSSGGKYDFSYAMMIFPVGFVISIVLSSFLREKQRFPAVEGAV